MSNNKPVPEKVSIITVVRNAVDTIETTLKSVLNQTYGNIEYIVIDGESTDGTLEIINKYRDRISIVVSEKDNGLYDALNKGVRLSTGDWIGILNSGDVFTANDVIANIFLSKKDFSDVDVLYGDSISVDGTIETLIKASPNISDLEIEPCYRHGASFLKQNIHKKYLFDISKAPLIGFALDYDQMYRMYKGGAKFRKIDLTVIKYANRGASTISPFKPAYYNYLITHNMKCSFLMRRLLEWKSFWRGVAAVTTRFYARIKNDNS